MKLNKSEDPLPSEFKKISITQDLKSIKIWVAISCIIVAVLYTIFKSNGFFD